MKLIKNIKSKANNAIIRVTSAIKSKSGEGYVDTAVKVIIAVVVGGVVLAGLYALVSGVIDTASTNVNGLFDYSGSAT